MMNNFTYSPSSESKDKLTEILSKYTEKIVNNHKSVTYKEIHTNYFLENNKWSITFFKNIEQFKDEVDNKKYSIKNISFPFNNDNINKEMKLIVYNKIFSDELLLSSVLTNRVQLIKQLAIFINENYPDINSFKKLNLEKVNIQWLDWLNNKNLKTTSIMTVANKEYLIKTSIVNFLESTINSINTLTDEREEWEKDKWDIRILESYGITYNKSILNYHLDFNKICNVKIRECIKKYMKERLITNNNFT